MLTIPSIFSHGMVLQRQKKIHFWGSVTDISAAGCRVMVELQDGAATIASVCISVKADSSWTCALPPQKAGGPYSILISLINPENKSISTKEFTDVMIGEVWLAGGQSNMEYELCNDTDGKVIIENPPDLPIRYFYTPKISFIGKELEEAESNNVWQLNGSEGMKHWSAAAYFAVQKMCSELSGITFGIIGCNWGGSYAVNWMDVETSTARDDTAVYMREYEEKVKNLSDEEAERLTAEYKAYHEEWNKKIMKFQAEKPDASWKELIEHAGECRWPGPMTRKHEFRPGGLYESMIKRIAPYSLRGFLYYQGESDDKKPHLYRDLLSSLIVFWRKIWLDEELFFMIFQLTVYTLDEDSTGCSWSLIRRAQEAVFKQMKNTGLTVLTDCGERRDIHPKAKKIPGVRAGEQILHAVYGRPYTYAYSPLFTSYDITGNSVKVHFSHASDGLYLVWNNAGSDVLQNDQFLCADAISAEDNPFIILDENGIQHPADVEIEKDALSGSYIVSLSSSKVDQPSGASYGWANWFNTMLYSKNGYAVSPFNTQYS
jgi:sialate O-acetylesterase